MAVLIRPFFFYYSVKINTSGEIDKLLVYGNYVISYIITITMMKYL